MRQGRNPRGRVHYAGAIGCGRVSRCRLRLGEQGGAALPGCLRCSWPKMREMRNCGRARLDTRVQLGSKCGVQGRFRRIETRIRLQSGSCRCNARFFVHHAVFYQACCPRRVASIGRDLLRGALACFKARTANASGERGASGKQGTEVCSRQRVALPKS